MMAYERCPHCHAAMGAMTNGFGGVYLQCLDCGYYEAVTRQADPNPSPLRAKRLADGTVKLYKRKADRQYMGRRRNLERPRTMSKEVGLQMLRDRAKALGRTPCCYELGTGCPHESWFRNNFGTFAEAVVAAGLTPRRRGSRVA